ncbi:DUF2194 domain-containing protein [Solibacillus sp. MA9]|uniref:DUF2194 domain-containing protein n=1 Tax=Solibacillus palustris TaxID=2908203 RepID=A0ABS9UA27_9BACL|nr:DUF2194 domain-containing protein [Solibacillus sp. MA9]MCH7321058.1 DUF2194 domain-containing protein [Solibacillus sp. MA9]
MNGLLNNKKIFYILILIFLCGVILQLSRSDFILNSVKNELDLTVSSKVLQPTTKHVQAISNAEYCILYNEEYEKLKSNIEKTLQYLKKPYKTYDAELSKVEFNKCPNILLATPYLDDVGTIDEIESFVETGGNLFSMTTLEPDALFEILNRQLGIIDYSDFTTTTGIEVTSNVLIGAKGRVFLEGSLNDSSLNVTIESTIEPAMKNLSGVPLLWKKEFGEGNFIILNLNIAAEKYSRGVIAGMLSMPGDPFIYPIFNSKTFFIDDFPAPIAKGRNEIIYKEFELDLPNFYRNVWWPDMLEASQKFNLVYTGALIESYEDKVTPPFNNSQDIELTYLVGFGRELINSGGEIGYHGYNHQSLTLDSAVSKTFGYNHWQSIDHMKQALREVETYTKKAFPSYTVSSYVPPSNVLSKEARSIIKEALPNLITIASLYSEDITNRSYVQEFEVSEDAIVEMPRISSGYFPTETNEWEIVNAITSLGVLSHFIHPDDVISEDRSKGGWTSMFEEFEQFFGDIHERYPWLHATTATNAALKQASTLNSSVTFEQTEEQIIGHIKPFFSQLDFILRTEKTIKTTKNISYEKIDDNTYLIKATSENFEIIFK